LKAIALGTRDPAHQKCAHEKTQVVGCGGLGSVTATELGHQLGGI